MKKQIFNFGKFFLIFLVIGAINSCGPSTKKEQKSTDEQPKVEEPTKTVENKVMHDGDNAVSARVDNMHLTRYIELFFAYEGSKEEGILAECFNTMFTTNGIPESKNTAPQDLVAGLDLKKLAEENGVANVSLNGPKNWTPDWTEIKEGVQRNFNGIEARWVATLRMGDNAKGVSKSTPYKTAEIERKSSLGWNKGTRVLLLDDAEGNTYIMKGFELGMNPKYTYNEFLDNAKTLYKQLPEGWKVRVITLEKDLIETPENGVAILIPDEFFNVFDKTGPGMMNYKP
jgi:hypothetical protein